MDGLMDIAPCCFVAFRDDGTIAEVNQRLCDILGYDRIELLGWHVEKLLPPGGRIFYHTHIFPLLKMHGHIEEVYVALRTKDGGDVPMLLNAVRRERDGVLLSDCVCMRLIQRHEYEQQLLEARRLAEKANAAKAKFLSMVSHDLRTPLTSIYGHGELLQDGMHGELNDQQREDVEIIREACRVLTRMIGDILEFAKLGSGTVRLQLQPIAVAAAIARAHALVRVQLDEAQLRFETTGCESMFVRADADRLQQILLNLLTNAIKFTPPGGKIVVSCTTRDRVVDVRVRDSGIGIPREHLDRIFAPFVQLEAPSSRQTASMTRGVGLGLAISRDLARAMSGDVTADSTPGSGSIFTITLPRADATEAAGTTAARISAHPD